MTDSKVQALISLLKGEVEAGVLSHAEAEPDAGSSPPPPPPDTDDADSAPDDLAEDLKRGGGGGEKLNRVAFIAGDTPPRAITWLQQLASSGKHLEDPKLTSSFVDKILAARHIKLQDFLKQVEAYANGDETHKEFIQSVVEADHGHSTEKVLDMLDAGFIYCSGPFLKIAEYLEKNETSVSDEEKNKIKWWGLYSIINRAMRNVGSAHSKCEQLECIFNVSCDGVKAGEKDVAAIEVFQPYLTHLRDLMEVMPRRPELVYRGITVNVSKAYKVKTRFRWPSYTSTSQAQETAFEYMQGRDGTFFVIISSTACDVKFVALHAEAELLYRSNTLFEVGWKLSPTLLRMIGCAFDVVVVREVREGDTEDTPEDTAQQLDQILTVSQRTSTLFSDYLTQYVEGRMKERSSGQESRLLPAIDEWLAKGSIFAKEKTLPRRPMCITGDGGVGKTSAAIAVYSHLANQGEPEGGSKRILPIFMALPTVSDVLLEEGGLDRRVHETFGLTKEGLQALSDRFDVILILDSLDETGISKEAMRTAIGERDCLFDLQTWCWGQCSVIVTTRGEYLSACGITPATVCGERVQEMVLQKFSKDDCQNYVAKVLAMGENALATEDAAAEAARRITSFDHRGAGAAMTNPFLLSMLLSGYDPANTEGRLDRNLVYERYLAKSVSEKSGSEDALRAAEKVACYMTDQDKWQICLKDAVNAVVGGDGDAEGRAAAIQLLRCLPVRVEDWNDEDLMMSFRHKSIAEYLCARRLWREPSETLLQRVSRAFSKTTPNIRGFFRREALRASGDFVERVKPVLVAEVSKTRLAGGGNLMAHQKGDGAVASNALCLLCTVPLVPGDDLSGVRVADADLRMSLFTGVSLASAHLTDCWLQHTEFHKCDMTGADFTGCAVGAVSPPWHGHEGDVYCVSASPDGTKVASGSADKTLKIWDTKTGTAIATMEGHTTVAGTISYSPDGTKVASGSFDKTVRVWDTTTGAELLSMKEDSYVRCVVFSPDGSRIASSTGAKSIHIWDATTGKKIKEIVCKDKEIWEIDFSPDGAFLVSTSGKDVAVLDAASGEETARLQGHTETVTSVVFSKDGKRVASSGQDKTVTLWDVATWTELHKLQGHTGSISQVRFAPNSKQVASMGSDQTIRMWEVATGCEVQKLEAALVKDIAFSPNGATLYSAHCDRVIRLWDATLDGGAPEKPIGHASNVCAITLSKDGSTIFSVSQDSTLRTWDTATAEQQHKMKVDESTVWAVALSPDESTLATGGKTLRLWDKATCEMKAELEGHTQDVRALAFSPTGGKLFSSSDDNSVRIWDLASGTSLLELKGHKDPVVCLAASPDGSKVVSASWDGTAIIWDTENGNMAGFLKYFDGDVTPMNMSQHWIYAVAYSPDGTKIATGNSKTIVIWDAANGSVVKKLEGHTKFVMSLTYSANGERLISGSRGMATRLWDTETGNELQQLKSHASSISGLAVTPDGTQIISGSYDKTVRIWKQCPDNTYVCSSICGMPPTATFCNSDCTGIADITPTEARDIMSDR